MRVYTVTGHDIEVEKSFTSFDEAAAYGSAHSGNRANEFPIRFEQEHNPNQRASFIYYPCYPQERREYVGDFVIVETEDIGERG